MNSLIAIELNGFLSEWVREHPITGKLQLDQRLVTMSVTLATTYLAVVVARFTAGFWYLFYRYTYKDHYLISNYNDDKIIHVWIKDPHTLYMAFGKFLPTLPKANQIINTTKKDKNKINFTIDVVEDDANNPWKVQEGGAQLPTDETIEKNKHNGLLESHYVIFQNRNIMVAKFSHGVTNYYHIFLEKRNNETTTKAKKFIDDFIATAYKYYKNYRKSQNCEDISVYEIDDGDWENTTTLTPKRPESIVGKNSQDIMRDVDNFENKLGKLYKSLDIPYKRGYLLYGPPGTGKTSVVKAVASCTKKDIYKVTFNEKNMDDDDYKKILGKTSINSIILMDDIDPKLLREGGYIEKTKTIEVDGKKTKEQCRVSYGTLLDALDGINANNGRIVFITTNHPDKMGKALMRPGRIDVKRKMDYAQNEEIKDYFQMFYKYFALEPDEIAEKAETFIKNVRDVKGGTEITFAELQQFLVQYMKDIETAVNEATRIFEHKEIKACV